MEGDVGGNSNVVMGLHAEIVRLVKSLEMMIRRAQMIVILTLDAPPTIAIQQTLIIMTTYMTATGTISRKM